jgi:hypothetical protein
VRLSTGAAGLLALLLVALCLLIGDGQHSVALLGEPDWGEGFAHAASGDPYTTPLVLNPDVAADYPNASGTLTYYKVDEDVFHGHIEATGLLPGFPYQIKLIGKPSCASLFDPADDWGNEQLGPEGFWWHWSGGVQTDPGRKVYNDYEEYDDCGHGDDPVPCAPACGVRREEVPHDFVPAQTAEWCYEGVVVFYGSFSDPDGNISWDFTADWSYPHAPPEDNRDDHPFATPHGAYNVRFVLNESAHNPTQYGGPSTAVWRGVLIDWDTTFEIGDADSDGISDTMDLCPDTLPGATTDGNGCSDAQVDADGDGVCDPGAPSAGPSGCNGSDNCPLVANPDQSDTDSDGQGDACDGDDDNDTVPDSSDADPLDPYACQDLDIDTCDDCSTLGLPDPTQDGMDTDADGVCNAGDPDDDNDTVPDSTDADPFDRYTCQDLDADTCDDCSVLGVPSPLQDGVDTDVDGACDDGDACTSDANNDADGDGICVGGGYLPPKTGDNDNCPDVSNSGQVNTDWALELAGAYVPGDALGDACDDDDDNDGWTDSGGPVGDMADETYLGTVALDNCPCGPGPGGDAWPLDIDQTCDITTTEDVWYYVDRIGATYGSPMWSQRLDLDQSGDIDVTGDVWHYAGKIGETCT